MSSSAEELALETFYLAARRVPAYQAILRERRISPAEIKNPDDFHRLPVLDKQSTFGRFAIPQLCLDGQLGDIASVLTSSGHSGLFAYGLADRHAIHETTQAIDDVLDCLFAVRSCPTLLINCLPMGVKVHTRACALAETSVRPDMGLAIVKAFGPQFDQVILVGDAAFVKLALELGQQTGLDWRQYRVHVVLGEELLAENSRNYIHGILGSQIDRPETGLVFSSMGIAEIGLNLFFEAPPAAPLIRLRSRLHNDANLRRAVLGDCAWVPSLFTFNPGRVFVEFVDGDRLVVTTLGPSPHIPLVRYAPGDHGGFLQIPATMRDTLLTEACFAEMLDQLPLVAIRGRGQHALAGRHKIYPEAIKEGIYRDPELARLVTANFRLTSGPDYALVRLQLSPNIIPHPKLDRRFAEAIDFYADGPVRVVCQPYATFGSGMCLDYERKFDYLGP